MSEETKDQQDPQFEQATETNSFVRENSASDDTANTAEAEGEKEAAMEIKCAITLHGPVGDPVTILIEGTDAEGHLEITTDLPQEYNGEHFQKMLAGTLLNILDHMMIKKITPEEREAMRAAKEEIANQLNTALDLMPEAISDEAPVKEPKMIRLGKPAGDV